MSDARAGRLAIRDYCLTQQIKMSQYACFARIVTCCRKHLFQFLKYSGDTETLGNKKEIPKQKRYRHTPRKNRTPIGSCDKRLRGYIASVRNDALAIGSICVAHVGYMAQRNPPAIRPKKTIGRICGRHSCHQSSLFVAHAGYQRSKKAKQQTRKARQTLRYNTKAGPKHVR